MENEDIFVLYNLVFLYLGYSTLYKTYRQIKKKRKNRRRWWTKPICMSIQRHRFGAFTQVFQYFKINDHEEFFKMTRMTVPQFDLLLQMVGPKLKSSSIRKPLSPEFKLVTCIRLLNIECSFLAHADSVMTTSWFFRVGKSTVYKLIPEVCEAIISTLSSEYLKFPNKNQWVQIDEQFNELWQLPNCLGAIDGKHCRIWAPPGSGSSFYNYKGFFSMVLMAICDAKYRFTWVDIGDLGSLNDAGIWANSNLCQDVENGKIELPGYKQLPKTNIYMSHYFVGDEAFPLKTFMMRPFSRRSILSINEKVFNYRLGRGRRVIENSFGIMVARWIILQTAIRLKVETSQAIIYTLVCLHNFLITTGLEQGHKAYFEDVADRMGQNGQIIEGQWRNINIPSGVFGRLGRIGANFGAVAATEKRNTLANYFASEEGSVAWQWDKI